MMDRAKAFRGNTLGAKYVRPLPMAGSMLLGAKFAHKSLPQLEGIKVQQQVRECSWKGSKCSNR
jgi:hypothetical protein